jgi:hypothetical protein
MKKTTLKTWLFTRPLQFALRMLVLLAIAWVPRLFPAIEKIPLPDVVLISIYVCAMVGVVFWAVYKLIKSLPLKEMPQKDFVALTNGYRITMIITFFVLFGESTFAHRSLITLPTPLSVIIFEIIENFITMFFLGTGLSSLCVKYRRARLMGLSPWQIILTMPFTFIMSWMPGYLIEEKSTKSNIQINSNWYSKFNKWTTENSVNTTFVFLFLILLSNVLLIRNTAALLFPLILFLIFSMWNSTSKPNFKTNMKRGYAWFAIIVNVILVAWTVYTMYQIFIMQHGAIIADVVTKG